MGEVVPSRAFLIVLVPSAHPQLNLRSVDFRSVHPKTCFGGGCVPLGLICPGGQIFHFYLQKPFPMGRIRLPINAKFGTEMKDHMPI